MEEGGNVEMRLNGSNGNQESKGTIQVRVANPSRRECEAVELLLELIRRQGDEGVPPSLPLMAYGYGEGVEGVDERAGDPL